MSAVYAKLEAGKSSLGITDWLITETTLEEVFLKIAQLEENGIEPTLERSLSWQARHFEFAAEQ